VRTILLTIGLALVFAAPSAAAARPRYDVPAGFAKCSHVRAWNGFFTCTIRYWRNEEGDVYASRHRCTRDGSVIRFYGMA
jgi:hypothetical protein